MISNNCELKVNQITPCDIYLKTVSAKALITGECGYQPGGWLFSLCFKV